MIEEEELELTRRKDVVERSIGLWTKLSRSQSGEGARPMALYECSPLRLVWSCVADRLKQDLEQMADAEVEEMRKRMTQAAQLDAINRREGKPAIHKLKMLPEVVSLLNRNQYVSSLVDPEINLLEAVKFFLEPLDDGSLPAYNIQRDLMEALAKLPINKEALIASGIGKVIVFYTKSKRPEEKIKRMAERLLAEWTRPILQRSDDYSKKVYEEVDFDPTYVSLSPPPPSYLFKCFVFSALTKIQLQTTGQPPTSAVCPGHCRGGSCQRAPSPSSGQPCSARDRSYHIHGCAARDDRSGEQVRPSFGSQWRGPFPQDEGAADECVEGVTQMIRDNHIPHETNGSCKACFLRTPRSLGGPLRTYLSLALSPSRVFLPKLLILLLSLPLSPFLTLFFYLGAFDKEPFSNIRLGLEDSGFISGVVGR